MYLLKIDGNRLIKDLHGHTSLAFLIRLGVVNKGPTRFFEMPLIRAAFSPPPKKKP